MIRIRGTEFTAFTNGLPQRYVLQAYPAGDGSVWVAGFNTFVPRGPCWLRRYHPDSQTTSAEVVVPGHLRRLLMTTNGVWLAAEQPAMIHYWDGQAPHATVVGMVDHLPSIIRLGSTALPVNASVRVWASSGGRSSTWAEVRLGAGADAPSFYWLWHTGGSRPWTGRWSGPAAVDATWLGATYGFARVREDRLEKIEIPGYAARPEISCLSANREGGVWFGTEEDGLHLLRERLIQVYTTDDGLPANDVRAVCAAPDGGIWAATSLGLAGWREGRWTPHLVGGLRTVAIGPDGQPWFGEAIWGDGALQRLTSRREFVSLGFDWHDPNSLRLAGNGELWVVSERGVTWLDPEKLVRISEDVWAPDPAYTEPAFGRYAVGEELPDIWPLGLVEDRDGSIWFGSLGHSLFRVSQGHVEAYDVKDGLPGSRCVPVYLDDSGTLWMVTDAGLTRRRDGQFETVTPSAGLPKDVLLDMIEDDGGNFWISGKRGIHRVKRGDLEGFLDGRLSRVESLTLGLRDGLLTPECSSLHYPTMAKTPDGHIWVATRNGLARFDPRRVTLDRKPLPAVIDRLIVNRREFPHAKRNRANAAAARGGRLRLPPGSGQRLEFHYTAVSLVGADRLSFRHRLEGYDTEWSQETDLRLAFYTNLRPGDYRFEVEAANAHGIWSSVPASLEFEILPFFWQTTLFRLSSVTALALAALGLHGHRLRTLRRLHSVRQEQALAAEKERIAADMHDELGAALTQITILGEVAKGQPALSPQTRSTLDRISGAARDVTARMSELVWVTNPRNDKLDNLVAYLREHAAAQLEDTAVLPRLEFPATVPDHRVSASFRRNLLLVVKEALNNVIKHSQASEVHVQLHLADDKLHLRIEDNGRGLAGPRRAGGNGLGNMERRIRDLGGEFTLEPEPGKGVSIRCTLPLK
ncbi:MAG: triple tyrosine motif-containing protein [Verrucomicrobiia bacterium]